VRSMGVTRADLWSKLRRRHLRSLPIVVDLPPTLVTLKSYPYPRLRF
jgi:hypothetical protein